MSEGPDNTTVLEVFHNSGHQFFAVPLSAVLPNRDEEWLGEFVNKNYAPWAMWDPVYPYIRYQYGFDDDGTPIIRIAVETNLGDSSRGLLFEVDEHQEKPARFGDEPVNPYAFRDEAQIVEDCGRERLIPLLFLPSRDGRQISLMESDTKSRLSIHWAMPDGRDPIDVDLIIDLGNTRTVALLLESCGQEPIPFGKRLRILRFLPRGSSYENRSFATEYGVSEDKCSIIDSWMILHRPIFAGLEPPVSEDSLVDTWEMQAVKLPGMEDKEVTVYGNKRYFPQTFVEISPALIGGGRSQHGAASIFSKVPLDEDVRFYLSSPKRYVWDDEAVGHSGGNYWSQIPNDTDPELTGFFDQLSGLIRVYMDPSGVDWDIDNPPTEEEFKKPYLEAPASYPRRDSICWYALAIIEAAHRQINSAVYLDSTGRKRLPRRLCNIRVTYPSGWTHEERTEYFRQWERAINIFTLTHFQNHGPVDPSDHRRGGNRPLLVDKPLDEAVCSQLPILYSDISSLMGDGETWFDLYGREDRIVVMNIDVGGGTTDVAVIEYNQKKQVRSKTVSLQPNLLFRDGNTIAGDALVKTIIESIILPTWIEESEEGQFDRLPEARDWIMRFFLSPGNQEFRDIDPRAQERLKRIIRLVFIPIANEWLRRLTYIEGKHDAPWEPLRVSDYIDHPTLENDLNKLIREIFRRKIPNAREWDGVPFKPQAELKCSRERLENCIDEVFEKLFNSLGRQVMRFNCDLVIISGKPSELPRLRQLLTKAIPLLPQRIIRVKNFPAGEWYPFSSIEEGKIMDAKTCTVVGAALYQDICNGNLEGFTVLDEATRAPSRDYRWGIISSAGLSEDFYHHENLLFRPSDYPRGDRTDPNEVFVEKTFTLPLNCRIGRQRERVKGIAPEPVYRLKWDHPEASRIGEVHAEVTLRWVSRRGEGEKLELVDMRPAPGAHPVSPSEVSLTLNTMMEHSFWLDDPKLDIREKVTVNR